MQQWNNLRDKVATFLRPGGPGNPWGLADPNGAMVEAPSGGGADVNSRFGVNEWGENIYLSAIRDGDPERYTTTLSTRLDIATALTQFGIFDCPNDVAVYQRCDDFSPINYQLAILYYDGHLTSDGFNESLTNLPENTEADLMITSEISLAPFKMGRKPLAHNDITKQHSDVNFNRVISVGRKSCPGSCGTSVNDGKQDFWAVTNRDNTPGYVGQAVPRFYYTRDGGNTMTGSYVPVFTAADLTDVIRVGERALVVSPQGGVAYAKYQDIYDGVEQWSLATGFTGGNFPRRLFAVSPSIIWAAGGSGRIWRSEDGGMSWTLMDNGTVTAQQINSISFVNKNLGYFAGNSGALVKYFNGAFSLVPVSDGTTTVTANLNVVATERQRDREVYVGTGGGQIWGNKESGKANKWSNKAFPLSGNGSVVDMQFAGWKGDCLLIIQNDINGYSRILRDISGGALGNQVEEIGYFTQPSQNGIVSIAMADINTGLCVGNIHETYGFIGKLSA